MTRQTHLDETEVEQEATRGEPVAAAAHLADCAQCTEAVARAAARRKLLGALPDVALDEVAFRRVERALFAPKPEARRWWWLVPAIGFAAAAAGLLLFMRPVPAAPESAPALAIALPEPQAPSLPTLSLASATPQFIQGAVEVRGADGTWTAVGLEPRLVEGAAIRTAEGRLAVSLEPGRGFVVEPNTQVEFQRLRAGQTLLKLTSGAVYCSLSALRPEETFAVAAGPHWVRVVGTAFAVTRQASRVTVEVEHGTVLVADDERGATGVRVPGPGELEVPDDAALATLAARALAPEQAEALRAQPAWRLARAQSLPLSVLSVTEPAQARVQVDELGWGPLPLFGRFPPGPHRVRGSLGGEEFDTTVVLKEGDAPMRVQLQRPAKVTRVPELPDPQAEALAAEISSRVAARRADLRYCYEHWLKRNPVAAGRLTLKVHLSDAGTVESTDALPTPGNPVPDETAHRCFEQAVEGLAFPAEAPAELELPLDFRPAD
jgi:ferric-dicitrate binding protein FerR (iron transport regulator)